MNRFAVRMASWRRTKKTPTTPPSLFFWFILTVMLETRRRPVGAAMNDGAPLSWNMKRRYITVLLLGTKCKWTSVTSSIVVIYAYVLYLVVRYISYLYILHVFIDRVAERKTTRMEKYETKDVNAPLAVERRRANVHGTAHYCSRLATTWPKSICLWRDKLKRAQVSVCFSSRGILKVWQPRPERSKPLPDD